MIAVQHSIKYIIKLKVPEAQLVPCKFDQPYAQ